MSSIEIKKVGITNTGAEIVVNAANEGLRGGSGVCGAIFDAAGWDELQTECDKIGHCDTGSAVITPACRLNAKYIVHAVGPVWQGGTQDEPKKLYGCYRESLRLAKKYNCHSIAFPLISSGIFGYPKDQAWRKALQACNDFIYRDEPDYDIHIIFAVIDERVLKMGQEELEKQKLEYGEKPVHPEAGQMHKTVDSGENSAVIGFYHENEEHGCFSNWYPCKFTVDGVTYSSSEQYMMAQKVLLFGRKDLAAQIMATDDPGTAKHIAGQHFPEYDDDLWGAKCYETVKKGVKAKFEQNPELKQELLATGNAILCECAPPDRKWGIGIGLDDPDYQHPDRWRGKNYLGFILMEVRAELS